MRLNGALMCDAATVRDGLLFVLGGAVSLLQRDELPSPLNLDLALVFEIAEGDLDRTHAVRISGAGPSGESLFSTEMGLQVGAPIGETVPHALLIPAVVPLRQLPLATFGRYTLTIDLDNEPPQSVFFRVISAQGPQAEV